MIIETVMSSRLWHALKSNKLAVQSLHWCLVTMAKIFWKSSNRVIEFRQCTTKHHPHFLVHFRTENSDSFSPKSRFVFAESKKRRGLKKEKEKGSLKWFKAYFCSGDVAMFHVTDRIALYKVIFEKEVQKWSKSLKIYNRYISQVRNYKETISELLPRQYRHQLSQKCNYC